ncbi:MAG: hypothetical protein V1816_02700 [Pseudomonadota bacterium]
MEETKDWEFARLEPGGRVTLPEDIMEKYVHQTLGCNLWFNQADNALGLRLLRGADNPAYLIDRLEGQGGRVRGVLDAGPFLSKQNAILGPVPRDCRCRYYHQYRLLEIRLGLEEPEAAHGPKGVLDSFPPLED